MKLLDRYVAVSFVKNYLISFMVLVGMYVVLDMIFAFDELAELNTEGMNTIAVVWTFAAYMADFYFYKIFLIFAYLSGMIPVAAAAFTLMRMVRFNELSAMLSAGVPLLRISMPIIVVGLLMNGLLWVDQEMIIPRIIHKLERSPDHGASDKGNSFAVSSMRDDRNGQLFAGRFFPDSTPPRMIYMSVVQRNEEGQLTGHISADEALWDGRGWKLVNGRFDSGLMPGQTLESRAMDYYQSSITPEEIQLFKSGDFVDLLSTERINKLLKRPLNYGQGALLRVKHTRGAAQIMLNMVLLLLAISAVLTREPQQLKMAATRCVLLCGACLAVAMLGQELATTPPTGMNARLIALWPAMMAWMPVFIFGPLSVWLLDRVKT